MKNCIFLKEMSTVLIDTGLAESFLLRYNRLRLGIIVLSPLCDKDQVDMQTIRLAQCPALVMANLFSKSP